MKRRLLSLGLALLAAACVAIAVPGCGKPKPQPPSATEVQEFQNALNDGDAAIVDRLLSAKPGLVNIRDSQGRTPLAQAKAREDSEMVQVIERHGGKE
jgi:hypothetical protein